jgi:hypothetical protein
MNNIASKVSPLTTKYKETVAQAIDVIKANVFIFVV